MNYVKLCLASLPPNAFFRLTSLKSSETDGNWGFASECTEGALPLKIYLRKRPLKRNGEREKKERGRGRCCGEGDKDGELAPITQVDRRPYCW